MLLIAAAVVLFWIIWGMLLAAEPLLHGSLAFFANRTAKFRYRDYLPVIVLLLAGAAVAVFAGDAFADLAEQVHGNSPALQQFDRRVHDWAVSERTPGSTAFFVAMSILGGPVPMGIVTGIAIAFLVMRRRHTWAVYLAVTVGGGALLLMQLKLYFQRARPDVAEMLRRAHGYSFPSGHAMGSAVVLGGLAYLAVRALSTWRQKSAAIAGAATLVISVALSRVYLGVHWLSDIAAGMTAGLVWLATTTVGYETFRRIRMVRAIREKRGVPPDATTPEPR